MNDVSIKTTRCNGATEMWDGKRGSVENARVETAVMGNIKRSYVWKAKLVIIG